MTMTLTLENPSNELIRAFKNMAKAANVKCKVGKSKEPKSSEAKFYTLKDSPAIKKSQKILKPCHKKSKIDLGRSLIESCKVLLMEIRLSNSADKFLIKQYKGDPNGIHLVRLFIYEKLAQATNPTALPNCKKMQGAKDLWRWRNRTLPYNRLCEKHRASHRNHKNIYA